MNVRKTVFYVAVLSLYAIVIVGCSGNPNPNSANEVPVVVTAHDAPPTNTTVLQAGITITGIKLTGSGNADATVLSSPLPIHLSNLKTQSELVADTSVRAGTYSSAVITFSSPTLAVDNTSS